MFKKGRSSSGISDTRDSDALDLYENSAKYYDLWTEDFTEDIDFYLEWAEETGSPILEGMCGTGRILIPLAEEGHEVVGVDRSTAMLDQCTAKISMLDEEVVERIDIIHEDVRYFELDREFRLAIVPYNSFLHLLKTEGQEQALKNISSYMTENGVFIMSVFNPDLSRPEGVVRHTGTKVTDKGEIVSRFESQEFDTPSQRTTIHYFYDISRQDESVTRVTTSFKLRYLFHREAIDLMKRCGLEVTEVYGDYSRSPFRKESKLMVFVARKS